MVCLVGSYDAGSSDYAVARFLQTTYEAAAELGGWDRGALECDPDRLSPLSMPTPQSARRSR